MPVLAAQNLSKTYSGAQPVVALNNVNLSLERGDLVAVVGDSGSGKSTLLHVLGGVDQPGEGKVYVQDVDITTLKERDMAVFRRRNIGIIYQFFNLIKTSAVHLVMEEYNNKCHEAPFSSMLGLNKTAARGVISWLDQVYHAGESLETCLCG